MPAKTPIYLKTTTDKKGRKLKLRDVLSGDMISPPLGDVRHSAHVGPHGEADMFGDVGFLQGKMDMLPSQNGLQNKTQNGHGRSLSVENSQAFGPDQDSYNPHYHHLQTTTSLPMFIAQEQAPPKPPRLHLDTAPHHGHAPCLDLDPPPHHRHAPQPEPRQGQRSEISLSPTIRRLVPSSGSFSEGSSDSLSDTCGPLEVPRGLSLDSDAGLSNEDLRSERSESPCSPLYPSAHSVAHSAAYSVAHSMAHSVAHSAPLSVPPAVPRSDSIMAGLDLDLGPSILDDVLSIMDRYTSPDPRCEL